jgi:hypothetical protein
MTSLTRLPLGSSCVGIKGWRFSLSIGVYKRIADKFLTSFDNLKAG